MLPMTERAVGNAPLRRLKAAISAISSVSSPLRWLAIRCASITSASNRRIASVETWDCLHCAPSRNLTEKTGQQPGLLADGAASMERRAQTPCEATDSGEFRMATEFGSSTIGHAVGCPRARGAGLLSATRHDRLRSVKLWEEFRVALSRQVLRALCRFGKSRGSQYPCHRHHVRLRRGRLLAGGSRRGGVAALRVRLDWVVELPGRC